jgi:hypothetical protein
MTAGAMADRANWRAHLLITTRRVKKREVSATKARTSTRRCGASQSITAARNGDDVAVAFAVLVESSAQPGDMDVEVALFDDATGP